MNVLAPRRHGGPGLPQRLVEALVPTPAVAVAVVQQPRFALRKNPVGLGELTETCLRVGGIGHIRMPIAGKRMEGALDRLPVGVPGEAQNLVVVPLDRGHIGILAHRTDTATNSGPSGVIRA